MKVPEKELLGAVRHKHIMTSVKYMQNDETAESKRIYARLNAARPPELKVTVDDPLKQRSIPPVAIKEVSPSTMERVPEAPWSVVASSKKTTKPVFPYHGMYPGMFPVGGTYNPIFPMMPPNYSYMLPVPPQGTKNIIYQGNVTINNY